MISVLGSLFLSGMGSALEIYPSPMTVLLSRIDPSATDADRLASDWQRVGQALSNAIEAEGTSVEERE